MSSPSEAAARSAFREVFGGAPTVSARAPGRIELLGNHTDYNGGLVLAAAIDRFAAVVGRQIPGREARVVSSNFEQAESFDLDTLAPGEPGSWGRYVRGVVWAIRENRGAPISGFEAAIAGDVPLGAGLSSSASLQAAVALFLLGSGLFGQWGPTSSVKNLTGGGPTPHPNPPPHGGRGTDQALPPCGGGLGGGSSGRLPEVFDSAGPTALDDDARLALAHALRRGENEYVGVSSGLLDQFSVLFGRAGHALSLDCRSLEYERLPLGDPAPAIVVCDSKTSRRLADGMYNRRRAECEAVVDAFRARPGGESVQTLRDISLDALQMAWDDLDPVGRRRARHVLTENDRVTRGAEALRAGDIAALGRLISASHASSRDDFENSAPALDALIEAAESAPGYLGGKLSGAGWAGCTVNLVHAPDAPAFADSVRHAYARRTGLAAEVYVCHAADGASVGS